jgi:membrane fusion protein (multidrug efflux system)
VVLQGATRTNAIAVPQVAVQDGPQGKFVYVTGKDKDGKDIAVVRPITLGDWIEVDGANQWLVESGLKGGDTVIVDGLAKLQPGGAIALGGPPPGAPGAGQGPAKDAVPAKDGAKAPSPKS